jgi:hypothetical protein
MEYVVRSGGGYLSNVDTLELVATPHCAESAVFDACRLSFEVALKTAVELESQGLVAEIVQVERIPLARG